MAVSGLLKALFDPMRLCLLFAFPESGALLLVAAVEKRSAFPLAEAMPERACGLGIESPRLAAFTCTQGLPRGHRNRQIGLDGKSKVAGIEPKEEGCSLVAVEIDGEFTA